MLFTTILSYIPYTFVTAFTPGPNNILSLYAVSRGGWKKGIKTLLGITAGFLCVMLICALFCYQLQKIVPSITGIMRYVGAAYILWLAIHVMKSGPDDSESQPVGFLKGFTLEFVNVKIILYAITVYTGYVLPFDQSLISMFVHAVVLTLIGAAGFFTWAAAGGFLQKFLSRHYRPFNIAMGLVLLYCAVTLALDI